MPPGCYRLPDDEPCFCEICGLDADGDCICPTCPTCEEAGNPKCYELGHLIKSEEQINSYNKVMADAEKANADEAAYWAQHKEDELEDY